MPTYQGVTLDPYTVPANVIALRVQAWGAQGRVAFSGVRAKGGYVEGRLAVTPFQVVYVSAPSGEGSAADVRVNGQGLANRAIVAGGAGGGGLVGVGGAGGGLVGESGFSGPSGVDAKGGTQSAGGARGTTPGGATNNTNGSFGSGGVGASYAGGKQGGDGGDGWYGGGGGPASQPEPNQFRGYGGGGGSSYVGGVTESANQQGVWDGTARVTITPIDAIPDAPTLTSLADGGTIDRAATNRARHIFSDPIPGDSQSAFNIRYRLVGSATWTGTYIKSPNPWYDFTPDLLALGDYERQVQTFDARGNESPWSASGFFTVANSPGGPAITAPINGSTVDQAVTVVWSAPEQQAYRARRVADNGGVPNTGTVYFDTGPVNDTDTRSLPLTFETNDRAEHVQVQIQVEGLWSPWSSVRVDVDYTAPPTPALTLRTEPGIGSLLVEIANPTPTGTQPEAVFNDVWVDDGDGLEKRAAMLPLNTNWRHWTPKSGRNYAGFIRVTATAANGVTSTTGDE